MSAEPIKATPTPDLIPIEHCVKCGKPGDRANDEYPGCVPYSLCNACYTDKFGWILESDFPEGSEPECVQCGDPAFKIDRNNHPYCLRHFRERNEDSVNPEREHFREEFGISDKPFITETFDIVKDKFDVEGGW